MLEVIDKFLNQYMREVDFYEKAARICAETCENELEREGIRAIVTYRAKRIDRLKEKLIKRSERKNYKSIDDIYNDIVDLAGVRIAIYFPNDLSKIDKFIKSKFSVRQIKEFPQIEDGAKKKNKNNSYKKIFSGYHATHYRVNLKIKDPTQDESMYGQAIIEIQVASVLMHAWAEVEHDLVYKPLNGELSVDEYEILDELNGLILAGELALKRLQKAVKDRVIKDDRFFSSHYELAAFIYDKISAQSDVKFEDVTMGRVDVFYKFLKTIDLNRPDYIDGYLEKVDPQCKNSSIVEQIIDMIISNDPSLYKTFLKVKNQMANKNPYTNYNEESEFKRSKPIFFFIDKWADLQYVMKKYIKRFYPDISLQPLITVETIMNFFNDMDLETKLMNVQNINTELIRGDTIPADELLINEGKKIEYVIDRILTKFDSSEREEIEKKINQVDVKID